MPKKRIPNQVKFVDRTEMQHILDFCKVGTKVVWRKKDPEETFKAFSFIEDLRSNLKVSFKLYGSACTYVFKLDTGEVNQKVTGVDSFKILSRYYKVPRLSNCNRKGSARPFYYINKKHNKTRNYAYGYDINSAYSWAMLQPIPNTEEGAVGKTRVVHRGEIGFMKFNPPNDLPEIMNKQDDLVMMKVGSYADIIFKEMESPFKKFVEVWYKKKNNAKDPYEKMKAKGVLNYSIGYLQNINPYIRATIITRVNERIINLIDDNTLYCNTDSLVSLVERPDLEANIGDGVGQWKLEHQGYFAYDNYNYQWDDCKPSYRGVPKEWFKKGFDILTDPIPEPRNKYRLNHETLKIEEIDYDKEESSQ